MSEKKGSKHRARYTLEFKLEAVSLVKAAQEASVWGGAQGDAEQLGEAGQGEDRARHLKKATACFAKETL